MTLPQCFWGTWVMTLNGNKDSFSSGTKTKVGNRRKHFILFWRNRRASQFILAINQVPPLEGLYLSQSVRKASIWFETNLLLSLTYFKLQAVDCEESKLATLCDDYYFICLVMPIGDPQDGFFYPALTLL